ncbi:hypothetical protein CQA66_00190 [Helicobacter aurati]|uniref:Uncharacterized protein n=1 Tax=Helicobacter aurati TaxID=137778 RepID=A0A3D8J9T2_9HELI|nr:hypothetical protein [Helicobacter aurati]RDU73651.1 hypothetical protein CQA66_00190 [Helicobacter aurati]
MEITPNPQVMLVVFIVFLITMFLLNRLVFQPIIFYIDQRNAKISNDLALASQDDKELEEIQLQIHKILSEAKIEACNLKSKTIQEAKEHANKKIEQIQLENREKMEVFVAKLIEQKHQMKDEIKTNLTGMESLLLTKIRNV